MTRAETEIGKLGDRVGRLELSEARQSERLLALQALVETTNKSVHRMADTIQATIQKMASADALRDVQFAEIREREASRAFRDGWIYKILAGLAVIGLGYWLFGK